MTPPLRLTTRLDLLDHWRTLIAGVLAVLRPWDPGDRKLKVIEDAPGAYVRVRAV